MKPTLPKKRTGDERDHSHDRDQPPQKKRVDNITCNGCGRSGHKRADCKLKDHPEFNKDGDWKESKAYKAIQSGNLRDAKGNKFTCIPFLTTLAGKMLKQPPPPKKDEKSTKQKGNCLCHAIQQEQINMIDVHTSDDAYTTPAKIMINDSVLNVNILFDTGALQGNYVNESVARWMRAHGAEEIQNPCRVCSAFDECVIINNSFICNILFSNLSSVDCKENSKVHEIPMLLYDDSHHSSKAQDNISNVTELPVEKPSQEQPSEQKITTFLGNCMLEGIT